MKIIENGDIFQDPADAIVIPVNCVPGVMGKGLALEAKKRFAGVATWHADLCANRRLRPGTIRGRVFDLDSGHTMIWLAATKDDWRKPSRLAWVEECCAALASFYTAMPDYLMPSVPALGCGEGGLRWADVLPIMERHFADLNVSVYAPLEGGR